MNASQATDQLTAKVCAASVTAQMDRRFAAAVVVETLRLLPSMEAVEHHGRESVTKGIKRQVSAVLTRRKRNGELKCGILATIFWGVIIGVIVDLIVKWLMGDRKMRELIQRAKA